MKIILCFLIALLLWSNLNAQHLTRVSGTVISASDSKALKGVSLTIKGSSVSTITEEGGNFTITVPKNKALVITHIGFITKEINTDSIGNTPITILLFESAVTMNEVTVSTGYQEINKRKTTGSYEKIDNSLFNRSTGTSILSRLEGIAGPVLFDHRRDAEAPLQIRGISTLGYASASPLIILDNFPYEGDINNINPNDVESVTILKDAAASSIWGARAGNGVIVITTKKGRFNQPSKLSFNTNVMVTAKPDLFSQKNMSASDYIDVEQFLFNKGYYNSAIDNTDYYPPVSPVVEILAKRRAGLLDEADATEQVNEFRRLDVRNDFAKYLYRAALTQQFGLNLSGGSKVFKYLLSVGYDKNRATLVGNRDDRATVRFNTTLIPVKNIQLDVAFGYTKGNSINSSPGGYNDISIAANNTALYSYSRLADDYGHPLAIDNSYRGSFTDTAGAGMLLDWKYRPLEDLKNVSQSMATGALIADIGMKYNFSKAINAEIKYQYQTTQNNSSYISGVNSFYARDLINKFTQYDGTNIHYIVPYGGILDAGQNTLAGYGLRSQVNFNKIIHTKHNISAIAGGEIRQIETASAAYRTYGYDNKLNSASVDNVNPYPTFDNIAGDAIIPGGSSFSRRLDRYVSMYANTTYTYNNLYTLSGSFRKDASNLFGVKANQKGIPLWSVGTAWNLSDEAFYHLKRLPVLKFRMSYGYGGNVSHSISALATISYNPAADQPIINIPFSTIVNYPNPNLKWEKVNIVNIGIDFASKNNRIAGSIEYFQKNSTDLLGREPLDPTVGTSSLTTNSANMKGHGLDVIINSQNIISKNFQWETNFLFSSVKNKVTKYLYTQFTDGYTSDGRFINPLPGYEPFSIVSFRWAGLDALGNPLGYIDGKKSGNYDSLLRTPLKDQTVNGSAIPHYFGAFRNTFGWKGLTLSVNITYRLGYYFRRPSLNDYSLFINGIGNVEYNQRWQKPGDENTTNVPALLYPVDSRREQFYQYSDVNVEKADHCRLSDIRVGYGLSPKFIQKLSIQKFEVFVYFFNLNVLIWKANKANLDPEFPTGLKTPVSMSFGIKTDF